MPPNNQHSQRANHRMPPNNQHAPSANHCMPHSGRHPATAARLQAFSDCSTNRRPETARHARASLPCRAARLLPPLPRRTALALAPMSLVGATICRRGRRRKRRRHGLNARSRGGLLLQAHTARARSLLRHAAGALGGRAAVFCRARVGRSVPDARGAAHHVLPRRRPVRGDAVPRCLLCEPPHAAAAGRRAGARAGGGAAH
eukprot:161647-Chlamydomonas_euryale.AAC.6